MADNRTKATHALAAVAGCAIGFFAMAIVYAECFFRTCENVWAKFGKFKCSECAMEVNAISTNTTTPRPIAFCPNCGARIRKAVE